jgi:hypothetical protein
MSELDPVSVAVRQIREVQPGTPLDNVRLELSGEQLAVLEGMIAGMSIKDAAYAAAVGRSTVFRWLAVDPYFKAAVNAWKTELRESAIARLSNMVDMAVTNIEKALGTGDAKLSYSFLKDLGFLSKQKEGATDPALVRQQIAADLQGQSPLADAEALTNLLTHAGLSRAQQRRLLIQALRPLRPEDPPVT